ncbi:MAG: BsuPI-related putative proteinase inhibitor [Clostridia bacterium]|nr:BsuPI-related putative proteinase inhibitor [Clostridia bacterium]
MIKLKLHKKVFIFSAVLVAVLCGVLTLTGASPIMPISASSTQQDIPQKKHFLTWEEVEALVDGNLTYGELFDTYDYNGMGAEVCTYTFAIEDEQPFSLIVISGDDINKPLLVQLYSENNLMTLDLNRENFIRMMSLLENSPKKEDASFGNQHKTSRIEISPENAANLQETANQGENLWLLDPKSVASILLGLKGGYFSDATGEAPSMTLEYSYEYEKVVIELYQPVKTGRDGIWLVKSYRTVLNAKNSSSSNIRDKGIKVEFDKNIESDSKTIILKPSQTITVSPELMEQLRQGKEVSRKPVKEIFATTLDIAQEDDSVSLDFTFCNISKEDLMFYFSSSQKFDIFIQDSTGQEVYRWSHNYCFLSAIVEAELKKGEKLSFSEVWDYTDNEGYQVPPGKYTITVQLLAKFKKLRLINPYELTAVKEIEVNYSE